MTLQVRLIDLVVAFSRALDHVSRAVSDHHIHVGYFAARLGERLGLDARDRCELLLSALLHDVGAISLKTGLDGLLFEQNADAHARAGWALIGTCPRLAAAGEVVLHHHAAWEDVADDLDGAKRLGAIVHLADRLDVQLRRSEPLAPQLTRAFTKLEPGRGRLFSPEHLDALRDMLDDPQVREGVEDPSIGLHSGPGARLEEEILDTEGVISFSNLFSLVIDSRSPFTATHSSGVAETARLLAMRAGLGHDVAQKVFVAGLLHDIGKLGVPLSILEKPGPLDAAEMCEMQLHAGRSKTILDAVPGFDEVSRWGALHHERLDGSGYPFGLRGDELEVPSRIIAVADVFTAIAEDRPYRRGMPLETACGVLRGQVRDGLLDGDLAGLLLNDIDEADCARRKAQARARSSFDEAYDICTRNSEDA